MIKNEELVNNFLNHLGNGNTEEVLKLLDANFVWQVAGDSQALPWIGKKVGRDSILEFMDNYNDLIESESFAITDKIFHADRCILLGHLVSKVKATGKVIDSDFVSVIKFSDNKITKYQLFEDSFMVSQAMQA